MIKAVIVGSLVGIGILCGFSFQQEPSVPYVAERICTIQVEVPEVFTKTYLQKTGESFNISAYTLAENECGRSTSDPDYGRTTSGAFVTEWQTIAVSDDIPFGTLIYIPYFKDKPNKGVFVAEDHGGAITKGYIDVYFKDLQEANDFGRRDLQGYIITREEYTNGDYKTICRDH